MDQLKQTKTILYEFVRALSENRKINLRYILILLPVAICMGAVCFIDTGIDSRLPSKILQLLLFTTAGILHLYFLIQKISFSWFRFLGDGVLYTSFAALLILISLLVFYSIADKGTLLMAFASSSVFAFPHILLHAWNTFTDIPEKEFAVWTKPLESSGMDDILFTGHISLALKITRKYFDVTEELFVKTVPEQNKLGTVFFGILEEENTREKNAIEYYDKEKKLYAWEFYVERLNGYIAPRRLDPELTLAENRLKPNAVVIVKRTTQEKERLTVNAFSRN